MKNKFCLLLFILTVSSIGIAQDADAIIKMAIRRSEQITHGYYEMTRQFKSMTDNDTSTSQSRSWFRKLPKDDCFGFAFHTNYKKDGAYMGYRLYTGAELVSAGDTSGTITSVKKWKQHIKDIKHNYHSYEPFTSPETGLTTIKALKKKETMVTLGTSDVIHGKPCHRILASHSIDQAPGEPMQLLAAENIFWIDKTDNLVIRYETILKLTMNGDTMVQYEMGSLDSFAVDQDMDETKLTLASLPATVKLKEYTPYKEIPLLSNQTPAPAWSLISLTNDSVRLEDLRGKVVLIDFWYKSCYPCMQALPALQSLHDKYKDQGLVVVGINPYDKPEDDLAAFLEKRNINYTMLYADRTLPKAYSVTGYPTLYIVDKDGNIVHGQSGYGSGTEKILEKIIVANL